MSGFNHNVVERVAQLNAAEIAQVLVWVSELRVDVLRQKVEHDVGTETHIVCDEHLAELDALLVALRSR